jgi:hypothetical protein
MGAGDDAMPRLTKTGWFAPVAPGHIVPMPISWQGWLVFLALIAGIAATVRLQGQAAWLARMAVLAAFAVVAYLTYDPDA